MIETPLQVLIVEDDHNTIERLSKLLESFGWVIASVLTTYKDALTGIKAGEVPNSNGTGKVSLNTIDMAFLDGNLSKGAEWGYEGAHIAEALQTMAPTIIRIGFSLSTGQPEGTEFYFGKSGIFNPVRHQQLVEYVNSKKPTP